MKNYIFLLFCFCIGYLKAQVTTEWFNYPGGVSLATDNSNNVFTADWVYANGGDITLTKRNAAGTVLWNASFDNTNNTRHEVATWVETDQLGNVLVCGTIRSGYSNPVVANSLLMKFNTQGTLLWRVVYETDFDGSSTTKCVVDANNNIYVLGKGVGPNGLVTKVKKFTPNGTAAWSYFDTDGIGGPINIKLTTDNHLLIVGRSSTGILNGYTKINLNGTKIWTLGGVSSHTIGDVSGDNLGNAYVLFNSTTAGGTSYLRKLSPTGTFVWEINHPILAHKVETGTDGHPIIGGYPTSGASGIAFAKFSPSGNLIWQNMDADGPSYNLLLHGQMRLDGNNAAYLSGGLLTHMAVCKVNSDGSTGWTGTSIWSSQTSGFDFGTDNSIFLTGGVTAHFTEGGALPFCDIPNNRHESSLTNNLVTLHWADMDAVQYLVQFRQQGQPWQSLNLTDTFLVKTNLMPSTTYQWRVRSKCGNTWTNYSALRSFTTPISGSSCTSPTNLLYGAITANSALVTWATTSGATLYQIRRKPYISGATWTNSNTTTNQFQLNNLIAGMTYQVQVRTRCGTTWFPWSPGYIFHTPSFFQSTDTRTEEIPLQEPQLQVRIFPNPASKEVFVHLIGQKFEEEIQLDVLSVNGNQILQDRWLLNVGDNSYQLKVDDWTPGQYFIHIQTRETRLVQSLLVH